MSGSLLQQTFVSLLPNLEQEPTYKQLDVAGSMYNPPAAVNTQFQIFTCPTDNTFAPGTTGTLAITYYNQVPPPVTTTGTVNWGLTSYGANYLAFAGSQNAGGTNTVMNFSNAFNDGSSSTILYAEKSAQCFINGDPTKPSQNVWGWTVLTFGPAGLNEGVNHAPFFAYGSRASGTWTPWPGANANQQNGMIGAGAAPQNKERVTNCGRPSSPHTGGINVVFADNSVRTIATEVDAGTWWALLTPDDSDKPGDY
jgi:prepilin-type processing-associated H-X9-DG protein